MALIHSLRALCLMLLLAVPALAQAPEASDEEKIRAVIVQWYEELAKGDKGRTHGIVAPGFIDSTPHYRYIDNGSRALGPRVYTHMSLKALKFAYIIGAMRIDPNFARVRVSERGYFYAAAAQVTYERVMDTTFVLERQEKDGRWMILAHQSGSHGISPSEATNPMPDLRALYYATEGKDRDPDADARKAKEF